MTQKRPNYTYKTLEESHYNHTQQEHKHQIDANQCIHNHTSSHYHPDFSSNPPRIPVHLGIVRLWIHKETIRIVWHDAWPCRRWIMQLPHRALETSVGKTLPLRRWAQTQRVPTWRFGCFRKWWYPQIIHFYRDFHYKSSILGYLYFWKPSYPLIKTEK